MAKRETFEEQCKRAIRKERNRKYKQKKGTRFAQYGITEQQYDIMRDAQNGVCAICGGIDGHQSLCIDHNHTTGKVRQLLCSTCNAGLGMFREDRFVLQKAIEYITKHWPESDPFEE